MFAFALIIVPMAEIMQGLVIKENSLIAGGSIGLLIGLFIMCCISAHVPLMVTWFMPLFIMAFAAMMIVPGTYLIQRQNENHERAESITAFSVEIGCNVDSHECRGS